LFQLLVGFFEGDVLLQNHVLLLHKTRTFRISKFGI
jgi:hypothetical protein